MKKLRIRIGTDGKVEIEVDGAVGPSCREFSRLFEQAVGEVTACRLKPEHDTVHGEVREETHEQGS
jgi:hypothetical protein